MPATLIPVIDLGAFGLSAGAADSYTGCDAVNGNYCVNSGKDLYLTFHNQDVSAHNVVLSDVPDVNGRTLQTAEKTINIAAGARYTIGPFDSTLWNQKSGTEAGGVIFTADDASIEVFPHRKA